MIYFDPTISFLCFSCKAKTRRKGSPFLCDPCYFFTSGKFSTNGLILSGWLTSVNLTKVKIKMFILSNWPSNLQAVMKYQTRLPPRLESLSCPLLLDQSVIHSVAFSCCRTCLWLFWNPFIRRIAVSWNWSRGYIIHFNSLASRTSAAK